MRRWAAWDAIHSLQTHTWNRHVDVCRPARTSTFTAIIIQRAVSTVVATVAGTMCQVTLVAFVLAWVACWLGTRHTRLRWFTCYLDRVAGLAFGLHGHWWASRLARFAMDRYWHARRC